MNAPLNLLHCPNEIAAIVLQHLPDSTRQRHHILDDLLVIIGEEHPLHAEVAAKLRFLQIEEANQLPLALKFRELIAAK